MDEAERLWAIQEIRRLKARRVRCMDEKDWPGYAACHTPDAVSYTFGDNDTFADSATGVVQPFTAAPVNTTPPSISDAVVDGA